MFTNNFSYKYVSGGAGEGVQLLRPEGMKNKQEVKSDSTLPAYCNPPNPCPLGYTGKLLIYLILKNCFTFSEFLVLYYLKQIYKVWLLDNETDAVKYILFLFHHSYHVQN